MSSVSCLACGQHFRVTYDNICGCMSVCCHIPGVYVSVSLDGTSICPSIVSKKEIYILIIKWNFLSSWTAVPYIPHGNDGVG